MGSPPPTLQTVFEAEYGSILAGLIRRARGDFERAEEALAEAFAAAVEVWGAGEVPERPAAWLTRVALRRLADDERHRDRAEHAAREIGAQGYGRREQELPMDRIDEGFGGEDDRLRLFFTCCHPALAFEAQVALTLNTLGGLTAAEIGRAFLTSEVTLAQRLVRAKRKIRGAGIPFAIPARADVTERIDAVLRVLYLVFNEGHTASAGERLVRQDLAGEALRLTRLLADLRPAEPEVGGLLGLMLLQHSRSAARVGLDGALVRLPDQDRSLWDRGRIEEGLGQVRMALAMGRPGRFQVQAAIAAVHAEAATAAETDWQQILGLYDALLCHEPSPVVRLNRAVALGEVHGALAALEEVEALHRSGGLGDYLYLHAARAEYLTRLGRVAEARAALHSALELAKNGLERRFLLAQLAALDPDASSPPAQ